MKKLTYKECFETRLDVYLNKELDLSRNYIQNLIDTNNIKVNEKNIKKSYKLVEGDTISITLPKSKDLDIVAQDIPLEIIFENDDYLIVNKPNDMVVHPSAGHSDGTLVNALMYHCKKLSSINGINRPGIVHRMDKDTTGVLLITKNNEAHNYFSNLFKIHDINRRYIAIINGVLKNDLVIEKPIGRDKNDRKKMAINLDGRYAKTKIRVLENFNNYTLVECELFTGRTHQIRVHLKSIGHSIVGDKTYGIKKEKFNLSSQLLHARTLGFKEFRTEKYVEYNKDAGEEFNKILNYLKMDKTRIK